MIYTDHLERNKDITDITITFINIGNKRRRKTEYKDLISERILFVSILLVYKYLIGLRNVRESYFLNKLFHFIFMKTNQP